jgi:hypothetical protein
MSRREKSVVRASAQIGNRKRLSNGEAPWWKRYGD